MENTQSITQVLNQINNSEIQNSSNLLKINSQQETLPSRISPATIELFQRYGTDPRAALAVFNPRNQVKYCAIPERCYFGKAPTLRLISEGYGRAAAESWLAVQLHDLSEFAGCKDKLSNERIAEIAAMMLDSHSHYRLTEFMLFFQRFKRGRYGRFYGSVDPMVIFQALDDFNIEREGAYEAYRKKKEREHLLQVERDHDLARIGYAARVPDAFSDKAPITFLQYSILGYDKLPDSEFYPKLDDIAAGLIKLPKDAAGLVAMIADSLPSPDDK